MKALLSCSVVCAVLFAVPAPAQTFSPITDVPMVVKKGGVFAGAGNSLYLTVGDDKPNFYRYDLATDSYTALADVPQVMKGGSHLVRIGGFIYATVGDRTSENFYRYAIATNTWIPRADTPDEPRGGGGLAYPGSGDFIYLLRGESDQDFYRYSISGNSWTTLADTPFSQYGGGALTACGGTNTLFAFQGDEVRTFWRYTISTATWDSGVAPVPDETPDGPGGGGDFLKCCSGKIFAILGKDNQSFLDYDVGSDQWTILNDTPFQQGGGSGIGIIGGRIFAAEGGAKNAWLTDQALCGVTGAPLLAPWGISILIAGLALLGVLALGFGRSRPSPDSR